MGVCLEAQVNQPMPHIIALHRLGVGPHITWEDSVAPIYAWASETSSSQAPLSARVEPTCILTAEEKVTINKVTEVDVTILEAELTNTQVGLDTGTATEKVRA